jgi:ribosomal protein L12E/L44/L45/RPP1/RPP2
VVAQERDRAQGSPRADTPVHSPFKVAINYRRSDTQGTAWALYLKLADRFGEENVFFDNGSLQPGVRFRSEIQSRLAEASALIALIGVQWLPSLNQHQRQVAEDYVVMEIDLALRNAQRVTVIPVLVDEAECPSEEALPPALKPLAGYQVERLRHTHFLHDVEHLINRLAEIAAAAPTAGADSADQRDPEAAAARTGGSSAAETRRSEETAGPRVAPPPDDDHYRMIVRHADHLVVFLGADVNADDRGQPWRPGSGLLPDDRDLAGYIAARLGLSNAPPGLAAVAQYAGATHGEIELFDWVKEVLRIDSEPGPVHRDLAKLPSHLGMRFQMIVTPKYDAALERAFREAGEAFDVAVYVTPRKPLLQGMFVHLPWSGPALPIDVPNRYQGFPIGEDGKLDRPVIVRVNGAVDDRSAGFTWEDNYVITEDHYIGYLSGRPAEEVVPGQILAKLRRANWLFLGYSITDWRLRVFLQRIFDGPEFGRAKYWAVASSPDPIERDLWQEAGATVYQCSVTEYLAGLHAFIASDPGVRGYASG